MASLIRMSEAGALGLHAVTHLAERASWGDAGRATAADMAKQLGASEAHLAKVLQRLARSGLVRSTRGPRGGFTLIKDPAEVTLLGVYEALEGTLEADGCLFGRAVCDRVHCIMGGLVERVNREVHNYMAQTTLDRLFCADTGDREPSGPT